MTNEICCRLQRYAQLKLFKTTISLTELWSASCPLVLPAALVVPHSLLTCLVVWLSAEQPGFLLRHRGSSSLAKCLRATHCHCICTQCLHNQQPWGLDKMCARLHVLRPPSSLFWDLNARIACANTDRGYVLAIFRWTSGIADAKITRPPIYDTLRMHMVCRTYI